ncbi:Ig-like domain-containing protein [Gordonia sp. NPDC003504]
MTRHRVTGRATRTRRAAAGVGVGAALLFGAPALIDLGAVAHADTETGTTHPDTNGSAETDASSDAASIPEPTSSSAPATDAEPAPATEDTGPAVESVPTTDSAPVTQSTPETPEATEPTPETSAAVADSSTTSSPAAIITPDRTPSIETPPEPSDASPTTPGSDSNADNPAAESATETPTPADAERAAVAFAAADVTAPTDTAPVIATGPAPYTVDEGGNRVVNTPTAVVAAVLGLFGWNPLAASEPGTPAPTPALGFLWAAWQSVNRRYLNSHPALAPSGQTTTDGVTTGSLGATDPDGDTLTYTLTTAPTHGTVVIHADGTYTYIPDADYAHDLAADPTLPGTDAFTITATDGADQHLFSATTQSGSQTTITVPIGAANNTPSATVEVTGTSTSSNIILPAGAHTVVMNSDGTRAYVTTPTTNSVAIIDTATGQILMTVPVGATPQSVILAPDGLTAYVVNRDSDSVSVVDTTGGTVTSTIPVGDGPLDIALSADGSYAYVTNQGSGTISVIDTAAGTVTDTIDVGRAPRQIAVSADGSRAYLTSYGSSRITVVDTFGKTILGTTAVGPNPTDVALNGDGSTLYVTSNNGYLTTIDTATTGIVDANELGGYLLGVTLNQDGSRAFVTDYATGKVRVVDTATGTVVGDLFTWAGPVTSAVSPDGSSVYVANSGSNALSVLRQSVTGTVTGSDIDGDTLTYAITTTPTHGIATVDPATGAWTYTSNDALAITDDTFTVTVSDGHGGTTQQLITVGDALTVGDEV